MARTVRVKVFKFNELSEDVKKKVIEKNYDQNTDYDWWEFVYGDFKSICALVGIDVDLKKTWFSGFSSQGDGAAFTADVDLKELIDGIREKKYLEHAPNIHDEVRSFTPSVCTVDRRVLALIEKGVIDMSVDFEARDRYYHTHCNFTYTFTWNECTDYKRIDAEMTKLEEWLQDCADEFTNLLYRLLEKDYEWRTSDEQIAESLVANEYEYTADGKRF